MYEAMRRQMLALLQVPAAPHPPAGSPGSLQVFRAGKNYYRLRLFGWGATQLFALAAIVFWTAMLVGVETTARSRRAVAPPTAPSPVGTPGTNLEGGQKSVPLPPAKTSPASFGDKIRSITNTGKTVPGRNGKIRGVRDWFEGYKQMLVEIAVVLPTWAFPLIWTLKITAFFLYLLQIPVTYAARRLDYELRWYMVTDRSLRLRYGVWKITESTMSFANVQQVVVSQGPLQRWLGLANVEVKSAGGGTVHPKEREHDMHTGIFQSVTNASAIRDLILERLRQFRAAGLGDPDERLPEFSPAAFATTGGAVAITAAREFLAETRALRKAIS